MRRSHALAVMFAVVSGSLVLLSPVASAQTGYPPAQCTAVTGTQDVGDVTVGQQFVLQLAPTCLFNPGATVNINANGVTFTDTAEQGGVVLLNVNVLSTTEMSINPVVPARCGTNTVTASGPSSSAVGGVSTQTANFDLICPAGPAVAKPVRGRLSLTGSNTVQVAAVAVGLVFAGALVVLLARRRRATTV